MKVSFQLSLPKRQNENFDMKLDSPVDKLFSFPRSKIKSTNIIKPSVNDIIRGKSGFPPENFLALRSSSVLKPLPLERNINSERSMSNPKGNLSRYDLYESSKAGGALQEVKKRITSSNEPRPTKLGFDLQRRLKKNEEERNKNIKRLIKRQNTQSGEMVLNGGKIDLVPTLRDIFFQKKNELIMPPISKSPENPKVLGLKNYNQNNVQNDQYLNILKPSSVIWNMTSRAGQQSALIRTEVQTTGVDESYKNTNDYEIYEGLRYTNQDSYRPYESKTRLNSLPKLNVEHNGYHARSQSYRSESQNDLNRRYSNPKIKSHKHGGFFEENHDESICERDSELFENYVSNLVMTKY